MTDFMYVDGIYSFLELLVMALIFSSIVMFTTEFFKSLLKKRSVNSNIFVLISLIISIAFCSIMGYSFMEGVMDKIDIAWLSFLTWLGSNGLFKFLENNNTFLGKLVNSFSSYYIKEYEQEEYSADDGENIQGEDGGLNENEIIEDENEEDTNESARDDEVDEEEYEGTVDIEYVYEDEEDVDYSAEVMDEGMESDIDDGTAEPHEEIVSTISVSSAEDVINENAPIQKGDLVFEETSAADAIENKDLRYE